MVKRRSQTSNIIDAQLLDEAGAIVGDLSKTSGNKTKAARMLNIHRTTLYYKLRKHNLV